ncbi:hypothetical protein BN1723_009084 [Verticillium longisporum]|uniref:mannan endo-1,6-alpha-mannosidase n=1 Tax=Verticillium longisporum TaxID=100787 RepID=A0A0G4KLM4_VERLO|nr:hypothetical protein BN1723_009084 [Verticillium longisporum]
MSPFNLEKCARPNILALQPYRCARDDYKDDGKNILLDANENAFGPSLQITVGTEEEVTRFIGSIERTLVEVRGVGKQKNEEQKEAAASDSIRNAASTIAHGAMSYYNGNVSGQPEMVGDLPDPYYWWQAGALWGAMLDYYHFTGDSSYNDVVIQALTAPVNTGPRHDYNPPEHFDELGNDDLGFWGFAVMAAAERNFPQPDPSVPSWLTMALNIFNALSSRWDTTTCRGGVYWQVFASNPNGINYKNSVTNGGLFQLAARPAHWRCCTPSPSSPSPSSPLAPLASSGW